MAKLLYLVLMSVFYFSCKEKGKTENVPESGNLTSDHPKLIKTIGSSNYGNVQCSLQDKSGNLWFGTTENGLYKYDGKSFTQFLVADGLNSNNVYSLLEDKEGKIWIGTFAGLCLYDPSVSLESEGKIFTEIKIPLPKNLPPNEHPHYRNSHWVYDIMQARNGKICFLTIDGIYIYDGKTFTQFIVDDVANGFLTSSDKAERILEDREGNIWFGSRSNPGVYRYDGKSVTHIKLEEIFQDGPTPKAHSWAWPQVQDKDGNIWFSNWGGAYRYNPSASLKADSSSFTSFSKKERLNNVARIIEDKEGNIWIGGSGLSRYDGKSFTHFTSKDGFVNLGVWSILQDKSEKIWIGTRATTLFLFDGKKFVKYSEYKQ